MGQTLEILVEGESQKEREGFEKITINAKQMTGRSPSNKVVHFPGEHVNIGDMVQIRIDNAYPHSLWGHPVGA